MVNGHPFRLPAREGAYGMATRAEAQQARRARERAQARSLAQQLRRNREQDNRTGTNRVALGATRRAPRAQNRGTTERGQTTGEPNRRNGVQVPPQGFLAAAPVYTAGSVHGPTYDQRGNRIPRPEPEQVGWLYGDGRYIRGAWRMGNPCLECSAPTEGGWCTRCAWVCDNAARPAPEPFIRIRGVVPESETTNAA